FACFTLLKAARIDLPASTRGPAPGTILPASCSAALARVPRRPLKMVMKSLQSDGCGGAGFEAVDDREALLPRHRRLTAGRERGGMGRQQGAKVVQSRLGVAERPLIGRFAA